MRLFRTTTASGRSAESQVATALTRQGFRIMAQNWRTRWCEIDVIARKQNVVYFVEVKYRSSSSWGDGLSYITRQKLTAMKRAASFWVHDNGWDGDYRLWAVAVDADGTMETVEL